MKNKIRQGTRQKNKVRTKIIMLCTAFTLLLTMSAGILVFLNLNNLSKTKASGTDQEGGGNNISNGDVITEFTWDSDPVTKATLGPDAINAGKEAHAMTGGRASTLGLSPGANGKDIDLEIPASEIFKLDGIDVSVDFRRNEESGDFFTRGNEFKFGIEKGMLAINYTIENKMGKPESYNEVTDYEVPMDPVFRNYRFIYTPTSGKAEIFVNSLIIWQHEGDKNTPLWWKNSSALVIGKNMNGGGIDRAIFDNFKLRNTVSVLPLSESLLNFMLEAKDGEVKIHWSTSANEKVANFTIERSLNGSNFSNLATIESKNESTEDVEYSFSDKTQVTTPIVYYRIRQTFKSGKFVTHPLSAIRFRSDKGLVIENIEPVPFGKTCDISYFLPKSGRVWLQVSNEKGTIVNTESFEAPQGKNVHVFNDEKNLASGTYTLSLIFDNMKVSSKLIKL
jgi:hypothetical protein